MKIVYVWSDDAKEYNCSEFRCVIPARALQRAGHDATLISIDRWATHAPGVDEICEAADLIIIQRNLFLQNLAAAIYWKAKGKVMAVDLDDAYHHMTEATGSPSYNFWRNGKAGDKENHIIQPPPIDILEWGAKIVGAVITPSPLLCADWQPFARTYYVPNFLDLRPYREWPHHKEPGAIYLGWGGSLGHTLSWTQSGLPQALNQICSENKFMRMVMVGDAPILKTLNLRPTQRISMSWRPYVLWSEVLSVFDIGLVPLAGEYDRRRSCLKSCELSIMGIPWIGSDLEPNRILGTGVLVPNTAEAWYKAIAGMIDYLPAYRQQAQIDAQHVRQGFNVDNQVPFLISTYERIIQDATA